MKKEARGCGQTCECPRMKYNFAYLESCYNYLNLIRDNFLTLDDIADQDWDTMALIMREEKEQKKAQEEHVKKVKELLG